MVDRLDPVSLGEVETVEPLRNKGRIPFEQEANVRNDLVYIADGVHDELCMLHFGACVVPTYQCLVDCLGAVTTQGTCLEWHVGHGLGNLELHLVYLTS